MIRNVVCHERHFDLRGTHTHLRSLDVLCQFVFFLYSFRHVYHTVPCYVLLLLCGMCILMRMLCYVARVVKCSEFNANNLNAIWYKSTFADYITLIRSPAAVSLLNGVFVIAGLRELLDQLLGYFGTRENIRNLLRLYETHCRSNRFTATDDVSSSCHNMSSGAPQQHAALDPIRIEVHPIAPIQVSRPENVRLLDCADLRVRAIFLGSAFLESVTSRKRPRIVILIGVFLFLFDYFWLRLCVSRVRACMRK